MHKDNISLRLDVDFRDLQAATFTVEQFRETVMSIGIAGHDVRQMEMIPPEGRRFSATDREVASINEATQEAVLAGRLMSFGDFPNTLMMDTSKRAGPLYMQGYLPMPFNDPWIMTHTWEGATAWYVVLPLEEGPAADFEAIELDCMLLHGRRFLAIGDRAMIECDHWNPETIWNKYPCRVCPSPWRFLPVVAEELGDPLFTAAGNVLDPVITALMILGTNGVARETIRAPEKLQRARMKNRKPPIPAYERVHTEPYVTAIMQRRAPSLRLEPKGGTHASPVVHVRRGHLRQYKNGQRTFIRDTLVAATADAKAAFHAQRSHYTVGR